MRLLERPIVGTPTIETPLLNNEDPSMGELFLVEYPGERFACIKLRSEPGHAIAVFSTPAKATRILEWIEQRDGKVRATTLDDAAQIATNKPPICVGVALADDIDNPKLIRKVR